jgi:hypothetical protein
MKKIGTLLAILLFTIGASAQEAKPVAKEQAKKESCCAKKDSKSKSMSAADVEKCKAKCKSEGKKCDATTGKKC